MMKKIICVLCFMLFSFAMMAQSTQEIFSQANRLYAQKDYKKALSMYQKIEKKHSISSTLYYNIGNTYFRLSDYASAILYYERGLRIAPNDANLNTNLKVAKARLKGDLYTVPDFVLVRFWKMLSNLLTPFWWLIVAIGLFAVACVLFSLYYFAFKMKVTCFYSFLFVLLLFIVSILCGVSRQQRMYNQDYAIVFAEQCMGKDSPDAKSADKVRIYQGSKIQILDHDTDAKGWLRVQTSDGKQAWIKTSDIKII